MSISEKLPFYPSFHCVGNTSVEEAEVILLTEEHENRYNRQLNARVIDALYLPGDLVLVESVNLGQAVNPKTTPQTSMLSRPVKAVGWDHEKSIQAYHKLRSELNLNIKDLNKLCFDLRYQNSRGRREMIVNKIIPLAQKIDPTLNVSEDLQLNIQPYSEFREMQRFRKIAEDILQQCEYAKAKRLFFEGVAATWDIRNDSLCTALQRFSQKGRRIFLIAGRAHIFPVHEEKKRELSIRKVQDILETTKFIIFDDRHNPLPDHFLRPGWKRIWDDDDTPKICRSSEKYSECSNPHKNPSLLIPHLAPFLFSFRGTPHATTDERDALSKEAKETGKVVVFDWKTAVEELS